MEGNNRGRGRTQKRGLERVSKHLEGLEKLKVALVNGAGVARVANYCKIATTEIKNQHKDAGHLK